MNWLEQLRHDFSIGSSVSFDAKDRITETAYYALRNASRTIESHCIVGRQTPRFLACCEAAKPRGASVSVPEPGR